VSRHALAALGIACALVTFSGCEVERPNFLGDEPDGGMNGGPSGTVRGGVLVSSGGGTVRSSDHTARVIVGAPQPGGASKSADHNIDLSTRRLLKP
jgi:hypothetical protein